MKNPNEYLGYGAFIEYEYGTSNYRIYTNELGPLKAEVNIDIDMFKKMIEFFNKMEASR